jgi:hypothetical protein
MKIGAALSHCAINRSVSVVCLWKFGENVVTVLRNFIIILNNMTADLILISLRYIIRE